MSAPIVPQQQPPSVFRPRRSEMCRHALWSPVLQEAEGALFLVSSLIRVSMTVWVYIGETEDSYLVANGLNSYFNKLPSSFNGQFVQNQWNAMKLEIFATGPAPANHMFVTTVGMTAGYNAFGPPILSENAAPNWQLNRHPEHCAFTHQGGFLLKYKAGGLYWTDPSSMPASFVSFITHMLQQIGPAGTSNRLKRVWFGMGENWIVQYSDATFETSPANNFSQELLDILAKKKEEGWAVADGTVLSYYNPNHYFIAFQRGTKMIYHWTVPEPLNDLILQAINGPKDVQAENEHAQATINAIRASSANFSNAANIAFGGRRYY